MLGSCLALREAPTQECKLKRGRVLVRRSSLRAQQAAGGGAILMADSGQTNRGRIYLTGRPLLAESRSHSQRHLFALGF